jgi:hypothetical protein
MDDFEIDQILQTPSRQDVSFTGGFSDSGDLASSTGSERSSKTKIEKETQLFFNYVKEMMMDANVSKVSFSGLLPAHQTTKSVAAQAFYHTLVLASKGMVMVKEIGSDFLLELGK